MPEQNSYNPYASIGAGLATMAGPIAATWGLNSEIDKENIKRSSLLNARANEAARIFSTLDPKIFQKNDKEYDVLTSYIDPLTSDAQKPFIDPEDWLIANRKDNVIPFNQPHANYRAFGIVDPTAPINLPTLKWTYGEPQAPSPELGSYAKQFPKTSVPPNTIQAVTVTPGAAPSRFGDKPINKLVSNYFDIKQKYKQNPQNFLHKELEDAKKTIPAQGGYIWGNTDKAQYDYALGNTNQGAPIKTENPSLYISRISADPSKEAEYLYTGDVLDDPLVATMQKNTFQAGPTWGIRGDRSSKKGDAHFRGDIITNRGELTTGDIQALLKERGLPFEYALKKPNVNALDYEESFFTDSYKPNKTLRENLSRLANKEGLDPYQTIEKFARKVPALGQPSTPPTPGIVGAESLFNPVFSIDKNSTYLNKTNLTAAGLNTEARIAAANRLVNSTVDSLIQKGSATKGLALGGLSAGLLSAALDPDVIDAASKGDYETGLIKAGVDSGIGAVTGKGIQSGLNALANAGYVRPAVIAAQTLPAVGGVMGGLGLIATGQALNRAYKTRTGTDWITRNQPSARSYVPAPEVTPTIQPRMGKAILNNKIVQVPYGSVAGTKTVGRPWWDQLGSKATDFANLLNRGSIIGR
jgi:hypothetical protein